MNIHKIVYLDAQDDVVLEVEELADSFNTAVLLSSWHLSDEMLSRAVKIKKPDMYV